MTDRGDLQPLREILHRALVRYITVRPAGFVLDGAAPTSPIEARILSFGGARTLYRARRPHCRSLDGVHSVTHTDRLCAQCTSREHCVPQVRLDIIVHRKPYRLLLAYSSARAFLTYEAQLRDRDLVLEHLVHRLTVKDRGSWGEIAFSNRQ
jgi:hypothetical protein